MEEKAARRKSAEEKEPAGQIKPDQQTRTNKK
jgi:hypothetical protein